MRNGVFAIAVALAASWTITSLGTAQQGSSTQQVTRDPASNPDQELGRRFLIRPENLARPKSDVVAASRSLLIPYAGQAPRVMEGFTATPFIIGLEHPRRLLVLPNNDVIVAGQKTGYLTLLRDQDGDGKADYVERYADDFKAPYGLAYRDGFVLVADQEGIWRVPHISGSVRAGRPDQPKITDVPPEQRKPVPAAYGQELITPRGVFGIIAGHQNRHLALDPQTGAMFVGVGSSGNIGVEPEVKASFSASSQMVPGKLHFPLECETRPPSHSTPALENSTLGFRSATDLVTIFRPITSPVSKRVRFTAGHMHISAPIRSLALHIGHRKKSKRPLFQMCYSKHTRQFWTWYFMMANNSRQNIAGTHL